MTYKAPVRDLTFALDEVADFGRLSAAFPAADAETVAAVLEGAGQLASDVLAPLNRTGDVVGARYENGGVEAAPGFGDAYRQFASGGWNGLSADEAFGGQGLPKALEVAVFEILQAANLSFSLCPMLTLGAIEAIEKNGRCGPEGALPAQAGFRRMDRHDEPDRAAGRLGSRRPHHPRRAGRRRRLATHRPEDLHHLGRPRHDGQYRPSRAGPPAERAARLARQFAVPGAEAAGERGRLAGRPQRRHLRLDRAQARHPRLAHLRHALRGAPAPNWSARRTPGWRRCS